MSSNISGASTSSNSNDAAGNRHRPSQTVDRSSTNGRGVDGSNASTSTSQNQDSGKRHVSLSVEQGSRSTEFVARPSHASARQDGIAFHLN